jgi:hypothetical protein
MATLKTVAQEYVGKAIFVNVPSTEKRVFEFFGITEEQMPTLVIADMGAESGDLSLFKAAYLFLTFAISAFQTLFYVSRTRTYYKFHIIYIYIINISWIGMKKYPYAGVVETVPLSAFVGSVLAGTVQPTLKTEDLAPEDLTAGVIVAKGKSFDDIVINNTKDVFVEFYAPW